MKTIITNYTFNPGAKTITFNDYAVSGISLQNVLLVVNATDGIIMFSIGSNSLKGTVASNVLTLAYDTTSMSSGDNLYIAYEDADAALNVTLSSLISGEDLENKVLGILGKPAPGLEYSSSNYVAPFTSGGGAPVTKAFIKSSPGNLRRIRVTNENASKRYLQLFNTTSAPSGGSTPTLSIPIPGYDGSAERPGVLELNETNYLDVGGLWFTTGISWAISTTKATFTDSATASEHILLARYV